MDKSDLQIVHETELSDCPVDRPLISIIRHRPTGELGVGAAWSTHEARDKAIKMLEQRVAPLGCTGLSARWCSIHGDCTCTELPDGHWIPEQGCPLHDEASAHG